MHFSFPQIRQRDANPWHDEVRLGGLSDLTDGRVSCVPPAADDRVRARVEVSFRAWVTGAGADQNEVEE